MRIANKAISNDVESTKVLNIVDEAQQGSHIHKSFFTLIDISYNLDIINFRFKDLLFLITII